MKKNQSNHGFAVTLLKGRTSIMLIVLLTFFSFAALNFFSQNMMLPIAKHVALYGILVIGMTYVIITGGTNLSVGAVVSLTGIVTSGLINEGLTLSVFGVTLYSDVLLIVLIITVAGALVGWLNGIVTTRLNVAPLIATPGTICVVRGLAMLYSNGATYSSIVGKSAFGNTGYDFFGSGIMGIPVGAIILVIIVVITVVLLKFTPLGWHVLAIGGNEKATKFSGIKVNQVKIMVYTLSGVCAAIVGIINFAQLVTTCPVPGESWEVNAIVAAVLDGTSMAGDIGGIGGTIVGAFAVGVTNDGMVMYGVSEFWQMVVKGFVTVFAVVINQFQWNLRAKMALQARGEEKETAASDSGGNLA